MTSVELESIAWATLYALIYLGCVLAAIKAAFDEHKSTGQAIGNYSFPTVANQFSGPDSGQTVAKAGDEPDRAR